MKKNVFTLMLFVLLFVGLQPLNAQNDNAQNVDPLDYGKMWTFEHAPLDYFEKTTGFRPDEAWLKKMRMSSLIFGRGCTASFISSDGLVLTNYHCSQGSSNRLMKDGEDFNADGFLAETLEDERPAGRLSVRQLVELADITDFVKSYTKDATDDESRQGLQEKAFEAAREKYGAMDAWKDLQLRIIPLYSGGKYSLYGYKVYSDVRLVMVPEMQIGLYGGDPDNFTYPRYNLDFGLWRVYENGKPLNSSDFYFEVNTDGVEEDMPLYLIGNPGRTERYRTIDQLEFDRDYRYGILLDGMQSRMNLLQAAYDENPSDALLSQIFYMSNSVKAYGGIIEGLKDPYLTGKKQAMEASVKSKSVNSGLWQEMTEAIEAIEPYANENYLLSRSPMGGNALLSAHLLSGYREKVAEGASEEDLDVLRNQLMTRAATLKEDPMQEKYLTLLLTLMEKYAQKGDKYVGELLAGRSPEAAAKEILKKTNFTDSKKLEKLLTGKAKKMEKGKDPIIKMANLLVPKYNEAAEKFRAFDPKESALMESIAGEVFNVYGLSIPPDATFSLRISDGFVKGYDYNGTTAPYKTTFFGMYDRFYSNDGQFPWSLPKRWQNPDASMLNTPVNFVTTFDSIGGNSGSPVLNEKGEIVGLLFDGNIESLSGNFIFDAKVNRSVCVHMGGIVKALDQVYKAKRLVEEMK